MRIEYHFCLDSKLREGKGHKYPFPRLKIPRGLPSAYRPGSKHLGHHSKPSWSGCNRPADLELLPYQAVPLAALLEPASSLCSIWILRSFSDPPCPLELWPSVRTANWPATLWCPHLDANSPQGVEGLRSRFLVASSRTHYRKDGN
jgi:hypothetical protein